MEISRGKDAVGEALDEEEDMEAAVMDCSAECSWAE